MKDVPEEVRALLADRDAARAAKDYTRADELRDRIAAAGFVIVDTRAGSRLERKRRFETVVPASIASRLNEPAALQFSVHLLYEGYLADLERFLAAARAHSDLTRSELVVVDNASTDGERVEELARAHGARAVHLDRAVGWAAARNAGLKTSAGRIVVLADLSIEPEGDMLGPLHAAFADPTLGIAGPFGLVSDDMRSWREDPGPEVDAIEGYLLAVRREALGELIHEKFTWYRNADIDFSFQIRAQGYRGVVVPLAVRKHPHRGWSALDEDERARRSKRNHYVFFDRWKDRPDLLIANRPQA